MTEEIYPTIDVPDVLEDKEEELHYKKSVLWDMEQGDFILDGNHKMVRCNGTDTYKIWCYKVTHTERDSCLAYTDVIGVDMDEALKEPDNEAVESAIERTITEAIMVHPNTEYVNDFSFMWKGEHVLCSFSVKGAGSDEFRIETEF